ncbi:hypothetical protein [Roseovarius sp. Pro17]|uniref:hypothetical protein n=1 Tax=Roseovarius sp. Pro17 TaxID=3108175 RepID=UPI002D78CF51|nr:hypothetical protein [Roseovarius sp. Pro17]
MVSHVAGAALRAILVAVLVALPSLMLAQGAQETSQIILLIAIVAGLLTFVDYSAKSPTIIEFRFASPINRIKFVALALTVLTLSSIARGGANPGSLTLLLGDFGRMLGGALDFPYSPVRHVLLLVPAHTPLAVADFVGIAAGLSYSASLVMVVLFAIMVRVTGWPVRRGAFNVWMNLPMFDPTRGGDVVHKLQREAGINISLGFLMPFLLPVIVTVMQGVFETASVLHAHTLIWMICGWAFLPAGLVMRGIAMYRVAELISAKRRRAYAQAEDALQTV